MRVCIDGGRVSEHLTGDAGGGDGDGGVSVCAVCACGSVQGELSFLLLDVSSSLARGLCLSISHSAAVYLRVCAVTSGSSGKTGGRRNI